MAKKRSLLEEITENLEDTEESLERETSEDKEESSEGDSSESSEESLEGKTSEDSDNQGDYIINDTLLVNEFFDSLGIRYCSACGEKETTTLAGKRICPKNVKPCTFISS